MKKRLKKLMYYVSTIISISFLMLIISKEKVYANSVFLDANNNFCIATADKLKTSNIWYRTEGFTITRCEYNPATKAVHPANEYTWYSFDFDPITGKNLETTTVPIGGVEANVFRVPLMQLIAGGSGEWVKEVTDALMGGPPVYIKFDSVMYIYHGKTKQPGVYWNECSTGPNPGQIQAAEAWANPAGLATHFNRYFLIGGKGIQEIEVMAGDTKITEEETPLIYATENWSDEYDLHEGIPSSKALNNAYRASKWWGETEVWARVQTSEERYEGIAYHYTGQIRYESWYTDNVTGERKQSIWYEPAYKPGTFDEMTGNVAFQYLANAEFYDLDITGVYNLAYDGTIYYDSMIDVPMKAVSSRKFVEISNEEIGKEKIDSWYADSEKHIIWADRPPDISKDLGTFDSQGAWEAAWKAMMVSDKMELQEKISSETKSWNDHLEIDDKYYLKGDKANLVAGCDFTNGGKLSWTQCVHSAAVRNPFEVGSLSHAHIEEEKDEKHDIVIPADTDNGAYPTGMQVVYSRLIKNDKYAKIYYAGDEWFGEREGCESIYAHCDNTYNEPVQVHTPVISPLTIKDSEGSAVKDDTQLTEAKKNEDVSYQLVLDNVYLLDWEEAFHRDILNYGASGKYSKYDEFVERKWMKFPFVVEYEGVYYEKDTWIQIKRPSHWDDQPNVQKAGEMNNWYPTSENHWRVTPIYIPSYAIECGGLGEPEAVCEYKVEAINVDGRYGGDHTAEQEEIYNKNYTYQYADDGAKYVATYKFPVQLSGIIYDFTITGTSDKDMFHNIDIENRQVTQDIHFAFCQYKMDKKVGTKNRFGENAIRYRTDGMLNRSWDIVNTLVLNKGKSNCWGNMGALWKGTEFSFSFKTIANLWSENTDWVEIKPTFRYINQHGESIPQYEYDADGRITKTNFKIYYKSPISTDLYVEYGTDRDKNNMQYVRLDHKEFQDSYYDEYNTSAYQFGDWPAYSVKKHNEWTGDNLTVEEFMHRENISYNLSSIRLDSNLRYLSGEYEQLQRNNRGMGKEFESVLTYWDNMKDAYNSEGEVTGPGYDVGKEDRFRYSMQTWYGQYYIPANLYIVDLNKHGQDFDLKEYAETHVIDPEKGTKGITEDDEVFEPSVGYLIINFDILTRNEGKSHLKYYGGNSGTKDMWKTEGFDYDDDIDGEDIDLESGDVVVVDLSSSINDKYTAGLFDIN